MLADAPMIELFKKLMIKSPYDAPNGKGRDNVGVYAHLSTGGKMTDVGAFNRNFDDLFQNKLKNVVETPAVVLLRAVHKWAHRDGAAYVASIDFCAAIYLLDRAQATLPNFLL